MAPKSKVEETNATATILNANFVPIWSVFEYCMTFVDVLDSRAFRTMSTKGCNVAIFDHFDVRGDSNIGACNRRWLCLDRFCGGIIYPNHLFDIFLCNIATTLIMFAFSAYR